MKTQYLTEKALHEIFKKVYGDNVVHNKILNFFRYRPDFVLPGKIIVEFDGPTHYTKSEIVLKDAFRDEELRNSGYRIIRIPFFIQLHPNVVIKLFGKRLGDQINIQVPEDLKNYPHGFIDENVILPADFCAYGAKRFYFDAMRFGKKTEKDIYFSLYNKAKLKINTFCVVPFMEEVVDKYNSFSFDGEYILPPNTHGDFDYDFS